MYFEPLTIEDVLNILDKEKPEGVIVQFGGQTAINLAGPLEKAGIKILGSSVESIDRAEDRERFDLKFWAAAWKALTAQKTANVLMNF